MEWYWGNTLIKAAQRHFITLEKKVMLALSFLRDARQCPGK